MAKTPFSAPWADWSRFTGTREVSGKNGHREYPGAPIHSTTGPPKPPMNPDFDSPPPPRRAPAPARGERFAERWQRLAARLDLAPKARLLVALSGGADSVLLTHLVAAAEPPLDVVCVHVDHGLRGAAARADAHFCESLCRSLGLPFLLRFAELDPSAPDLEAAARDARYRILLAEARRPAANDPTAPPRIVLTGHHADDALETLLMRWMRGGGIAGLSGLRERVELVGATTGDFQERPGRAPVTVLRPLIAMRRAEVRRVLGDRGLAWREDATNGDRRFFRNRVRHGLVARIEAVAGAEGLANLEAFSRAVESLEDRLAAATAHIAWHKPAFADATAAHPDEHPGGEVARRELVRLSPPLLRRTLWRLITEGCGASPSRALLDLVGDDLKAGRCARHSLPRGWSLVLRSDRLQLVPPAAAHPPLTQEPADARQALMLFADPAPARLTLPVPGIAVLPDGRRITAELETRPPELPRGPREVLLDADTLLFPLELRLPGPGDRFHPLGAPGGRPLRRFLSDAGVPREERGAIPLVVSAGTIVWAAGLRPAEPQRVRPATRRVVRLSLLPARSVRRGSSA